MSSEQGITNKEVRSSLISEH